MPYFRCPNCALLAHVPGHDPTAIACPRCRALSREEQLRPVEESLRDARSLPARLGGSPPQD